MAQRNADLFKVSVSQVRQYREVDVVLGKALRVLPETELLQLDDFLQPPIFFRVVRHTLDEQGRLAERAVLSGQHTTRDEAQAALELEAAKNTPSGFDPKRGNWRITDKHGKAHWLIIDPF